MHQPKGIVNEVHTSLVQPNLTTRLQAAKAPQNLQQGNLSLPSQCVFPAPTTRLPALGELK